LRIGLALGARTRAGPSVVARRGEGIGEDDAGQGDGWAGVLHRAVGGRAWVVALLHVFAQRVVMRML
jgi:hypothetical protein